MSRVVDETTLRDWFAQCQESWPQTEYQLFLEHQNDPSFKRALETAYLLGQVSGIQLRIIAMLFVLEIPLEQVPEGYHSFLRQLNLLKETSNLSGAQEKTKEILRKMLLAIVEDVQTLVIILANQVVRMRHLKHEPDEIKILVAEQTRDVFAPLANRLGLSRFKWELEDEVLHYLKPQDYKLISKNLNEKRIDREVYIQSIIKEVEDLIAAEGIEGEVSGRVKHIYSIWKKMTTKGKSFEELLDVRAVRVIVKNLSDCYRVLGMVHEKWPPLPREFDDYIANPKPNGYQSLHTAVLGPQNKAIEVQIRTRKMHEHAELGVAAHWHYKESDASLSQQAKLNRVRQLLDQEANSESSKELLDKDLFGENVYVLTPNREAIELVAGATPLDFAYQIHTNLGHRCRGAKVNGRIVPLTYVLNNGDEVEILTGKNAAPSRDWLSPHLAYVKSNRTRAKIRSWFKQQAQEKNIAAGKQLLDREFSRLNLNLSPDALLKIAKRLNCNSINELHAQLGAGEVTINQFLTRLPNAQPVDEPAITPDSLIRPQTQTKGNDAGVRVQGVGNLLVQMAACCKPAPPELIGGFVTINRGVVIHRKTCSNFINMIEQSPAREIDVDWGYDAEQRVTSDLMIKAHSHQDLLKEVNNLITNEQLRIIDINMKSEGNGIAQIFVTLELNHLNQLSRLIDRLSQLPFVIEAHRK